MDIILLLASVIGLQATLLITCWFIKDCYNGKNQIG